MKKFYIIFFIFILSFNIFSNEIKDEIFKAIGARASGMGGAFTAIADDYSAVFWNPAGQININKINATLFFDSVFSGKQNVMGFNYIQPLFSDMSFSLTYLKILFNDSKFINDFFYLSFATFLREDKKTAFGINLKLLNFSFADFELNGFTTGFDIGFLFFPDFFENKFRFSLSAVDLDARIKWSNGIFEKIPSNYKAGVSFLIDKSSIVSMDLSITNSDLENKIARFGLGLGAEKYFFNETVGDFGIRTGIFYIENLTLSFGISYKRQEFSLNYAFIPGINNLGQTHKLDFTYYFGEVIRKEDKKLKEDIKEVKAVDTTIALSSLKNMQFGISQKYISPNNDGKYDSIKLILKNNPSIIPGGKWTISIKDNKNVTVKEIDGVEVIQPVIVWDGKDSRGKQAKDGDYTIVYSFFLEEKLIWQKTRIATVDTQPPLFKLDAYPKIFAPVENSKFKRLQINIDFKDKDVNFWTVNILDAKNNIVRKISGEGITDKIYWNGYDALGNLISDGNYKIKFVANDFAGNAFEQIENISVDTYISNFNLVPDKRIFVVGKDNVNMISNKKDLNKIKRVEVQIYDSDKHLIKMIKNKSLTTDAVAWDGTNEKNEYVRKGSPYYIKTIIEQNNGIEIEKEYIVQSKVPDFEGLGIQLILATVNFENVSSEIPVNEYAHLNQAAEAVEKYAKNYFLILRGYATDIECDEKNLQLSVNRIKAVFDYLVKVKKINPENIYLTGYGNGNIIEPPAKNPLKKFGTTVEVELLTK